MIKPHKLVILGLGHVGSAVLARALSSRLFAEIVTVDILENVSHGEALDAEHATPDRDFYGVRVRAGDYSDCADADVIVCAAGGSIGPGASDRLALARQNIPAMRSLMAEVTRYTKDAVMIFITNPLDVVTYVAATEFDYRPGRLFGTGTSLETLRLKRVLADRYAVNAVDVQGYVLGEHGNSGFTAFSTVAIGGVGAAALDRVYGLSDTLDRKAVGERVVKVAYEVNNSKGWTNTGIATAAISLARAALMNEHAIYPVSMPLNGEYGLSHVALSLPSVIGASGVEKRLLLDLTEDEVALLAQSAESVKVVLRENGVIGAND
mgnify:CR=1 FL=1